MKNPAKQNPHDITLNAIKANFSFSFSRSLQNYNSHLPFAIANWLNVLCYSNCVHGCAALLVVSTFGAMIRPVSIVGHEHKNRNTYMYKYSNKKSQEVVVMAGLSLNGSCDAKKSHCISSSRIEYIIPFEYDQDVIYNE